MTVQDSPARRHHCADLSVTRPRAEGTRPRRNRCAGCRCRRTGRPGRSSLTQVGILVGILALWEIGARYRLDRRILLVAAERDLPHARHLLHRRRRLHRHQLHLPLDHPRLPHRHHVRLAARPVVLVVAQLCGGRAALHHLPRVDPEARARAAHHPGVRHGARLQGRDRHRADARRLDAHHLCRRQGGRSGRREAVLFAGRNPLAGVPQAGRAVLHALDHLGAAREHRARADRRDRRRIHLLAARPRPQILYAGQTYDIALVWVAVLVLSTLSMVMYAAVSWLESVLRKGVRQ